MYESSLDASDSSVAASPSSSSSPSSAGLANRRRTSNAALEPAGAAGEVRAGATDLATDLATPEPLDTFAHCSGSGARSGRGSRVCGGSGEGRESGERFGRRRGGRWEGAEGEGAPLHARGELSVVLTVAAAAAAALLLLLLLGRAWDGGDGEVITSVWRGSRGRTRVFPLVGASRRGRRRAASEPAASSYASSNGVGCRNARLGRDADVDAWSRRSSSRGGTRTRRRDVLVHRRRRLLPRRAATATVAAGVELAERREHGHA